MAKIRNSNPKQSGGGYERLVGDFEAFCKADEWQKAKEAALMLKGWCANRRTCNGCPLFNDDWHECNTEVVPSPAMWKVKSKMDEEDDDDE